MKAFQFETGPDFPKRMDSCDALSSYRDAFHIPKRSAVGGSGDSACTYLCGNSLGLQPKKAREFVLQELSDWERLAVEGHFHSKNPWLPYHEFLTPSLARLVGAKDSEVVAMNTLTVNQHLMMVSFFQPQGPRNKLLIGWHAFPSNRYAAVSHLKSRGLEPGQHLLELEPRPGESVVRTEEIEAFLQRYGDSVSLIFLEGVNYYSGQALEFERIIKAAHAAGCLIGFDLAHAAGNLDLRLHDWGADFAVWCSYKYLNGGPGCVAGCFVHERHAERPELPRYAGWWGNNKETRFLMGPDFDLIPGAEGWQLSNPPILPLACLRASLELFDQAGISPLREKSVLLTGYLEFLVRNLSREELKIITPADPHQRGCQLSISAGPAAKQVLEQLSKHGVVCDFREPDVIRVAPAPLYNSFQDVYDFSEILGRCLR
ncbi:MAG: kynureninase [Proteobacteria bacterium]|nr:MAG: kynureninase [Pseudomonadota bacterium]